MHVSISCVSEHAHTWVCVWRLETNIDCLPQFFVSTLCFETGPLPNPGAQQFRKTDRSASRPPLQPWNHKCAPLCLTFYMGAGNWNSGPHTYGGSSLQAKPSLQPLKICYRAEVIGCSYGTRRDVGWKKYSFRNRPENYVADYIPKKKIKINSMWKG